MCDFNHPSQTFWKVWTYGVPLSSSMNPCITVQQKMFHGIVLMLSIRQLTQFRLVMHLGRHTSSHTWVPNHQHHRLGWKRHELNTCNALLLLEQQIATSDFLGQAKYVPYQEFDAKGDRTFSNLISGDWASHEAVCLMFYHTANRWDLILKSQDTIARDQLSLEVTKWQYPLLPVIRNIIQCIFHQAYLLILPTMGMEMWSCLSHFYQYQKVCLIFFSLSLLFLICNLYSK